MTERVCATGIRRYRSRSEAEQLVRDFESSGFTREQFCARNHVAGKTFNRYMQRYAGRSEENRAEQQLVAVEVVDSVALRCRSNCGSGAWPSRRSGKGLRCKDVAAGRGGAGRVVMFSVGSATRIYVAAGSTDMRKGFEGLFGLVRDRLECDPLSGRVFLFSNAQRQPAEACVLGWKRAN